MINDNLSSNEKEKDLLSNYSHLNTKSKQSSEGETAKWTKDEDKLLLEIAKQSEPKNWEEIVKNFPSHTVKQCMSRYKKLSTADLIKGPWTYEEDRKLLKWIQLEGPKKWSLCAETISGRSGKQCRERWFNALNPQVKKGEWTIEEDFKIYLLYSQYGGKWSKIALNFPNRTENSIKNRFYSSLRKLYSERAKQESMLMQIENISTKTSVGIGELIKLFPIAMETITNKMMKSKKMTLEQLKQYENELIENSNQLKNVKKNIKKDINIDLYNNDFTAMLPSTNNDNNLNEDTLLLEKKKEKTQSQSLIQTMSY